MPHQLLLILRGAIASAPPEEQEAIQADAKFLREWSSEGDKAERDRRRVAMALVVAEFSAED